MRLRPLPHTLAVAAALACAGARPTADPAPSLPSSLPPAAAACDSVTGRVAVVGADPFTWVELRRDGARGVRVVGPAERALRRVDGLTVAACGTPAPPAPPAPPAARVVTVRDFVVRAAGDTPARDGWVVWDVAPGAGAGLVFLEHDGRRTTLPDAAAWRALLGARIWVTGPLEAPTSIGRVADAPR